jgi:hypothetical protein
MALGAFATMTLLTKNSFLDEIRKQYVMTARAKGCSERQVLYGHVFRNAMLIVIAGFPAPSSRLLLRLAADRDHLLARRARLLGFESVLNRDYPVVFGTLFIFSLVGLVVNLISDLPICGSIRGSISRRGKSDDDASRPPPVETTDADAARRSRADDAHRFSPSPLNARRWQNFKSNRRGYWSFWIFLSCSCLAVRRIDRQ